MNINFHYFVIKTLACLAGFAEEDAQTIAYASQLVDDFRPDAIYTDIRPPQFFFDHNLAKERMRLFQKFFGPGNYCVTPLHTGIPTFSISPVTEVFQKKTITPFHFIPVTHIETIMSDITAKKVDRTSLRCVACREIDRTSLIGLALQRTLQKCIRNPEKKRDLVELGMLLHVYADTFSHEGFSGQQGWENHAKISSVVCDGSEVPVSASDFYYILPSVGHANVGHLPDVGAFIFTYQRKKGSESDNYSDPCKRDNRHTFMECAQRIFKILYAVGKEHPSEAEADRIFNKNGSEIGAGILKAYRNRTSDDDEVCTYDGLVNIWSTLFPQIKYYYDTEAWLGTGKGRRSAEEEMVTITDERAIQEILQIENEWKNRFGIPDSDSEPVRRDNGIVRRGGTVMSKELELFIELSYVHSFYVNTERHI